MSPSLKYLMVSSIAARKASCDPMSLTATLGVGVACVLLVMCGLAPADKCSWGALHRWPLHTEPTGALDLPGRPDQPDLPHGNSWLCLAMADCTRTRRVVQNMRARPVGQSQLPNRDAHTGAGPPACLAHPRVSGLLPQESCNRPQPASWRSRGSVPRLAPRALASWPRARGGPGVAPRASTAGPGELAEGAWGSGGSPPGLAPRALASWPRASEQRRAPRRAGVATSISALRPPSCGRCRTTPPAAR